MLDVKFLLLKTPSSDNGNFTFLDVAFYCRAPFWHFRDRWAEYVTQLLHVVPVVRRIRKIAKKRLLTSSHMSICLSAWNNSAPTGRIFMKFDIWVFFENLSRKLQFHYNLTRITQILHEDQQTFLIISRSVVVRVSNVSDKISRENQNTPFMCSNIFFFSKIVLLWDNVENNCTDGQATRDNIIRCMRTAYWGYKITQNMQYILLFTATKVGRTRLNVTL